MVSSASSSREIVEGDSALYSCRHAPISALLLPRFRTNEPSGHSGPVRRFDAGIRIHCQVHSHREVQEDVSGLFILFIHC